MAFQDNLRKHRELAGYAQAKDFADALGIKYTTYTAYENQGREPKFELLVKMAGILNVSTDTLLDVTKKEADPLDEIKIKLRKTNFEIDDTYCDGKIAIMKDSEFICAYDKQIFINLLTDIIGECNKLANNAFSQKISLLFDPKFQQQETNRLRDNFVSKVITDFEKNQEEKHQS